MTQSQLERVTLNTDNKPEDARMGWAAILAPLAKLYASLLMPGARWPLVPTKAE